MNKAVFLDRDGVINKAFVRNGKPFPPKSIDEVEILPGVKEALLRLKSDGYLLIVVTNQPDVARGTCTKETVEEINEFLLTSLPIDEIFCCFHDDADKCDCRKPLPGLILSAARKYNIVLSESHMIGDRWRDIEAGINANCNTIYIDYGYDEKRPLSYGCMVDNLLEASKMIMKNKDRDINS